MVRHRSGGDPHASGLRHRLLDMDPDHRGGRPSLRAGRDLRRSRRRVRRADRQQRVRVGVRLLRQRLHRPVGLRVPGPRPDDVPPAHPLVRGHGRGGAGGGRAAVPRCRRSGAHHRGVARHVLGPSRPEGERDGPEALAGLHRLHGLRGDGVLRGRRLLLPLRRGGPRVHGRGHRGLLGARRLDRPLRQRRGGDRRDRVHDPGRAPASRCTGVWSPPAPCPTTATANSGRT